MNYKIEKYIEGGKKLIELDLSLRVNLVFLPENINEIDDIIKCVYPETTTDLKKILNAENIMIEYLSIGKPLLRARKSAEWVGPTFFISYSLLTGNQNIIGIALNVISSYLYDFFKGSSNDKKVKFDIVIENDQKKEFQKISYEGSVDGVKELKDVIKALKR